MWNIASGECIYDTVQKKIDGWEPSWMEKLNICAKKVGNTVNFYKDNNFSKTNFIGYLSELFLILDIITCIIECCMISCFHGSCNFYYLQFQFIELKNRLLNED